MDHSTHPGEGKNKKGCYGITEEKMYFVTLCYKAQNDYFLKYVIILKLTWKSNSTTVFTQTLVYNSGTQAPSSGT